MWKINKPVYYSRMGFGLASSKPLRTQIGPQLSSEGRFFEPRIVPPLALFHHNADTARSPGITDAHRRQTEDAENSKEQVIHGGVLLVPLSRKRLPVYDRTCIPSLSERAKVIVKTESILGDLARPLAGVLSFAQGDEVKRALEILHCATPTPRIRAPFISCSGATERAATASRPGKTET